MLQKPTTFANYVTPTLPACEHTKQLPRSVLYTHGEGSDRSYDDSYLDHAKEFECVLTMAECIMDLSPFNCENFTFITFLFPHLKCQPEFGCYDLDKLFPAKWYAKQ